MQERSGGSPSGSGYQIDCWRACNQRESALQRRISEDRDTWNQPGDVFACAPGREVTTLVAPDQALVRPTPCNPFRINIIISVLYARSCVSHTKHRGLCVWNRETQDCEM